MEARVAEVDGSKMFVEKQAHSLTNDYDQNVEIATNMGKDLANKLIDQGANTVLEKLTADL